MAYYVLLWNPKVWTAGIGDAIEEFKKKAALNLVGALGQINQLRKATSSFLQE